MSESLRDTFRGTVRSVWNEPAVVARPSRTRWDVALAVVLVPVAVLEGVLRDDVTWMPFSIAAAVVCVVAIPFRRSHPLVATIVAFSAQTLAGVLPDLAGHDYAVLDVTSCVLLFPYSVGRWASGRAAVAGVAFVLAGHFVREPLYGSSASDLVVGAGFLLFPAALGASVRFGRTARRRAVEQVRSRERERLARELHDTVAHHVSAIVIQAQAGQAVAKTDPVRAVDVLASIEGAAARSLTEMRSLVGILRDEGAAAERTPVPVIADLRRLASDTTWPVAVDLDVSGDPDAVGGSVSAAVYRIVQEALTNVRRHATSATRVQVEVQIDDSDVVVRVLDDGRASGQPRSGGYGLVGMAERVELLGGTFAAGPRAGERGWGVQASLPAAGGRS